MSACAASSARRASPPPPRQAKHSFGEKAFPIGTWERGEKDRVSGVAGGVNSPTERITGPTERVNRLTGNIDSKTQRMKGPPANVRSPASDDRRLTQQRLGHSSWHPHGTFVPRGNEPNLWPRIPAARGEQHRAEAEQGAGGRLGDSDGAGEDDA